MADVPLQTAITEIVDLPTAETDDALVLAPDGLGGVEFRAETGGGALTDHTHAVTGSGATGGGAALAPTSLTLPGGGLIGAGTSFPGSPSDNDHFLRTDTECGLYRYESTGTKWLCCTTHLLVWTVRTPIISGGITASATLSYATSLGSVGDMWIEDLRCMLYVVTTSDGSKFWTITLDKIDAANSATNIGTVSTVSNTADTWVEEKANVDAVVVGGTYPTLRLIATKTSTAGNLIGAIDVSWRHVFDV